MATCRTGQPKAKAPNSSALHIAPLHPPPTGDVPAGSSRNDLLREQATPPPGWGIK